MSFFGGRWYPYFGFLVVSPFFFKARVGSTLFAFFCRGECNIHPLRSTSGATCADLLAAGSAAGYFLTCISRSGALLWFEQEITQTEDKCTTIVPASRLSMTCWFTLKEEGQEEKVHL